MIILFIVIQFKLFEHRHKYMGHHLSKLFYSKKWLFL